MLDREEYVEQSYFFRTLAARMKQNMPAQDMLGAVREEILATTKLPLAIDFMAGELRLHGIFASAMAKLSHYFTPFQTYVISEAERERGKFDMSLALEILEREARYRSDGATPQGIFLYEFESLCRNRLGYDRGLEAVAGDDIFDQDWKDFILASRHQIGLVELADLIYVRSEHYLKHLGRQDRSEQLKPILFGEKEGRIALANRRKDPLLLFGALHRQLGYPEVPRPSVVDESANLLPHMARRMERLEARLKLLEEEQKGGIDITKFYGPEGRQARWHDEEP